MCYVYMLRLSDETLYCGMTNDLKRRMKQHREGRGSKYVKGRLPFELVYLERCDDRSEALQREAEIKGFDKDRKEDLVEGFLEGMG